MTTAEAMYAVLVEGAEVIAHHKGSRWRVENRNRRTLLFIDDELGE